MDARYHPPPGALPSSSHLPSSSSPPPPLHLNIRPPSSYLQGFQPLVHTGAFTAPLPAYHSQLQTTQPPALAPRPRLKRSHPTDSSTSSLSSFTLSGQTATSPLAPPGSVANPLPNIHLRTRSSSANSSTSSSQPSTLDPIVEWPLAEASSASSPPERASALGLSGVPRDSGRETRREREKKRIRRKEPDHEALGRLSLASPALGNGGGSGMLGRSVPLPPPSALSSFSPFPSTLSSAPVPTPHPLFPSSASLGAVDSPSSPVGDSFTVPAAPPTSPVSHSFPTSPFPPPPAAPPSASAHLPSQPGLPSPFFSSPPNFPLPLQAQAPSSASTSPVQPASAPAPQQEEGGAEDEVEMAPAASSWDIDPHRIYVASLADEADSPPPSPPAALSVNPLALPPSALPTATSSAPLLPPTILSSLRHSSHAPPRALILYQPPPAFPGALGISARAGGEDRQESAKERALWEKRERRDQEFEEYRRERGELEGGAGEADGGGDASGGEGGDGMDVD